MDNGVEKVYNYGYFNFNAPNFVWRFVLGQTDYMVGSVAYRAFLYEYVQRGSSVIEQELNLTSGQVDRLYTLLEENCRPENMVYRYNYFYNNCTTKARDKFVEALALVGCSTQNLVEGHATRQTTAVVHRSTYTSADVVVC
jgi:hypothetical protein